MKVRLAMSQDDISVTPWITVRQAAAIMREEDISALPVLVDDWPVGIITDRDIAVRLLPEADDAGVRRVSDAMTPDPLSCFADQDVVEAVEMMGEEQIRHLLVLDRSGSLIGMLSIEDIAENVSEDLAGQALGEIAEKRASAARTSRFRQPE